MNHYIIRGDFGVYLVKATTKEAAQVLYKTFIAEKLEVDVFTLEEWYGKAVVICLAGK